MHQATARTNPLLITNITCEGCDSPCFGNCIFALLYLPNYHLSLYIYQDGDGNRHVALHYWSSG